uniref:Solute carrier family 35 member F1 n=1 Tax=Noccaea caerulescens TaxID=107243 RepID=A0A1J3ETH0_NOCCA
MGFNFKEIKTKKTLIGLGLGQIISLLCTCNAFTSSELARKGINAPTTQSFLSYTLLAIVYGSIMLYQRPTIKAKWYHYFLLALVDVEGNFLVVKAYQYTSITSVMLLDCWAIPCVLVLTWAFLHTKYRLMKISGVVICIVGVVMVVFSDVHAGDRAGGSNPVKGDFLVIAGATLYAVSNTNEKFLVKNANTVELVTFLGFFGAVISAIQIGILERGELKAIHWSPDVEEFIRRSCLKPTVSLRHCTLLTSVRTISPLVTSPIKPSNKLEPLMFLKSSASSRLLSRIFTNKEGDISGFTTQDQSVVYHM